MHVEATKTVQRFEVQAGIGQARYVGKGRRTLLEDRQNRLEFAGIEKLAHVTRLLEQRIDLAAGERTITRGAFIERDLLNFHTGRIGDEFHRDTLHRTFLGNVGDGCLAVLCLDPFDERIPVVETIFVGANVHLRKGDL